MEPHTITVVEEGIASATPTIAYVTLGATTTGTSARAALEANSVAMAGVHAAVRGQAVADTDVQTAAVSVSPVYAPHVGASSEPPAIAGYTASNSVRVTVRALGALGPLIDAVIAAGANTVHGVAFAIADPLELQVAALKEAMAAARAKAEAVAAASGLRVGNVVAVVEHGADAQPLPFPRVARVRGPAQFDGAPTPIQQGEVAVRARVTVTYQVDSPA